MRRRTRTLAPPPPVVVSDTARVVLRRTLLGAVLLGLASAVADRQVLGALEPADVLVGAALGLLAGPLALGERAAHLGRPWAALAWCAGLAVVGLLAAAVQAGFAARVLATGAAHGAHAATYADAWVAALDPSTLPVVLARALPLALVPVLAGRLRGPGLVLGVLLGGVLLPWTLMATPLVDGAAAVLLPGHGAAWGLPTGPRASLEAPVQRATWLPGVGVFAAHPETAWLRPLVLRATALDALALALAALLGDLLARRRHVGPRPAPRRALPLARAVPSLAVASLAALTSLRLHSPPPSLVGELVDRAVMPQRRDVARRLLDRLGPADADAVPALASKLGDPAAPAEARALAARLLARIGPPALAGALAELGRATADPDEPVRLEALGAIEALGPAARPLAPDLLRALLRSPGTGREPARLRRLLDAWGYSPTVDELLDLLHDPDERIVAGALARLVERRALSAEHARLLHEVAARGAAVDEAVAALAGLGEPAVALLRERLAAAPLTAPLSADDPILLLLERDLPAGSEDVLALAARHPLPHVRAQAARALDARRPAGARADALPLLVELLGDAEVGVHEAARRTLRSHTARAARPLADEVERRGPSALTAATLLGELGIHGRAAVPALARALSDGDPALRLASARALGRIGGGLEPGDAMRGAALAGLIDAVANDDEQVAGQALEALRAFVGFEGDDQVRAALLAALDAASPVVRGRAAMSLVHGGGATRTRGRSTSRSVEQHLPRILSALEDALTVSALRAEALQALSALGHRARAALPSIYALVRQGEDLGDALRAIAAIDLAAPGALEAVARVVRFGRVEERLLALGLVRSQGPRAAAVLDDLAAALVDPLPQVRRDAALVLLSVDVEALARVRPALEARRAHEDDPQTAALLTSLLRRLDGGDR